jgi:hypothetical protein
MIQYGQGEIRSNNNNYIKYKTKRDLDMISTYYKAFLTTYNSTFFNRSKKFAYDAFIPESTSPRSELAQAALEATAKKKFKIAKKIRHRLNNIIELFAIVSSMEDPAASIGIQFSEKLDTVAKRFFADLTTSINSLGNKDSVTFISRSDGERPVLHQFATAFNVLYVKRFEDLYSMIKREVGENELTTMHKQAYATVTKTLTDTFNSFVLRYKVGSPNLFFSQNSHNTHFSNKSSKTANKKVSDVAIELNSGLIEAHDMPLSVFPSEDPEACFAKNNRTLAAFFQAAMSPTRLVPILPTTEEARRPAALELGGIEIEDESNGYITPIFVSP